MSKAEEKRQREQLIRQVRRLTRARVNDASSWPICPGRRWRPSTAGPDGYDGVQAGGERSGGDQVHDRLKALEKLMELIRENRETEAEELLRTLGGTAEEPEWER